MTSREHPRLSPVAVDEIVIDDLVGVAVVDAAAPDLPVRWANPALAALLGRAGDTVTGRPLGMLVDDPALAEAVTDPGDGGERTVRVAPPGGGGVVLQLSPTGRDGEVVVVATPAHASPRAAMFDAVTGLASLALFTEHLQLALRRRAREGHDLAVAAIGAPRFAAAWQQHEGTASVLQARMAERIEQVVRDADVLAARRPGNFLLLIIDPRDAVVAATLASERLFDAFAVPIVLADGMQPLELAVGIGGAQHDDEPEQVIARADAAHARAVAAGTNRYRVDQPPR